MKTSIVHRALRHGTLCLAVAGGLFAGASRLQAASSLSPVGKWDCSITGREQKGTAFFLFSDDGTNHNQGTFLGYRFFIGKHIFSDVLDTGSNSLSDPNSRGSMPFGRGDLGRTDSSSGGTGSGSTSGITNIWGVDEVNGHWLFDDQHRLIGTFEDITGGQVSYSTNENVSQIDMTTTVPITNADNSITWVTTNTTVFVTNAPTIITNVSASVTNTVSFRGRASMKNLTLVATTGTGKLTYSGTRYVAPLTDLSGSWLATRKEGVSSDLFMFDLLSVTNDLPDPFTAVPNITNFPSLYVTTNAVGVGQDWVGIAALSKRKTLAFVFMSESTNGPLTASIGSLKKTKTTLKANTSGAEYISTTDQNRIKFNAVHQF